MHQPPPVDSEGEGAAAAGEQSLDDRGGRFDSIDIDQHSQRMELPARMEVQPEERDDLQLIG